jgi:hypothetical protein
MEVQVVVVMVQTNGLDLAQTPPPTASVLEKA